MNNEKLNSTPKLSIAKREIFRICKDPVYFFCMLVAPTICVVFFLSLMKEGLPTDMPVAVVDLDGSSNSRNLARQLDAFEQTKVMLTTVSFEEARQAMQEGKVYGIWYLSYCCISVVSGYENHVCLSRCFGRASDGTGAWLY